MHEDTVTVRHEKGLHARPASVFVQSAQEFESDITIQHSEDDKSADAKSSIQVMSLGIEEGDSIEILAEGDDEGQAIKELTSLVKNNFNM